LYRCVDLLSRLAGANAVREWSAYGREAEGAVSSLSGVQGAFF